MLPTGNTKDKIMSLFTKCVTALLDKMLYNKARIAPIAITEDDGASSILDKTNLPTNFTKLGKHIMISGGSWVFNKKQRGNNNVYRCFQLKLQIPTKEIISRVSFEFSCLPLKNSDKNAIQYIVLRIRYQYSENLVADEKVYDNSILFIIAYTFLIHLRYSLYKTKKDTVNAILFIVMYTFLIQ
jgi:hypothetical protein